jgi:hypothetical protein
MQKKTILDRLGDHLLKHYDPKDADIIAEDICLAIREATTPRKIDDAMVRINTLMHGDGFGHYLQHNSLNYWGNVGLLYVSHNGPTIIYDVQKERWFCAPWKELVETQPRRFR